MNNDFNQISNIENSQEKTATGPEPFTSDSKINYENPTVDGKQSSVPYFALLTTFVILFVDVIYSVVALISYAIDKLVINKKISADEYGYIPDFSSYIVIGAVASFVVATIALILITVFLKKDEEKETWRKNQKWRRIIYTVGLVVLILGLVGSLTSTVYNIISITVGNDDVDSYSSIYSTDDTAKNQPADDKKIIAAGLTGLATSSLLVLGIIVLGSEYASKRQKLLWVSIVIFALVGTATSVYGVTTVQQQIKDAEKATNAQKAEQESTYNYDDSQYADSSYDSDTTSTSNSYEDILLDNLQKQIENYALSKNNNKYPTKEDWSGDNSTYTKTYNLDAEIKSKVTYSPEGCDASGCTSYTLSIAGSNDQALNRKSDPSILDS